jgi:ADP-ribose pyrophosphatase
MDTNDDKLLFRDEVFQIVGCAIEVNAGAPRRLTQRNSGDASDTDGQPEGRASRERASQTPPQRLPLRTAAATVRGVKESGWKTISSERHFANLHLEVVTDQVETPARPKPRAWTIVHRKAAVVVAPITRDGKIVLIHQERIPIREAIWEMPSGQIDAGAGVGDTGNSAETIEQVALRELREEAGYELAKHGDLVPLGHYFTSPGFTDERGYFFLARPVVACPNYVRDESEAILDCRAFTVAEIRRMIAENEIRDANTLSIMAWLWARGLLPGER